MTYELRINYVQDEVDKDICIIDVLQDSILIKSFTGEDLLDCMRGVTRLINDLCGRTID